MEKPGTPADTPHPHPASLPGRYPKCRNGHLRMSVGGSRFSRHHVFRVIAGDPITFEDLRSQPLTKEVMEEATRRIIDAITSQVAIVREEPVPTRRWDPELKRHVPIEDR